MPPSSSCELGRDRPTRSLTPKAGILIAVAWLPFFGLWTVMNVATFSVSLRVAMIGATSAIGSAALLGLAAWWVTGRVEWPERFSPTFYAIHLFGGTTYSAIWIVSGAFVSAALWGRAVETTLLDSGWRFVMGLWLYGFVAGVSYVIRFRARLSEKHQLALRAEALATEARLGQLRSQINPHFLFNALHTVSYLISHDAERAKDAVERLGDMLRYAIDEGGDLVPLEREWTFAQDYLAIERTRLEERLVVVSDIEACLGHVHVPVFSLQTLVENAVRHGASRTSEPTHLTISARSDSGRIVISVRDDGPGADPARIETAEGLGLRNLRGRLASHFGEFATLRLDTSPGKGFQATISIPSNHPARTPDTPPRLAATAEVLV